MPILLLRIVINEMDEVLNGVSVSKDVKLDEAMGKLREALKAVKEALR